MRWTALLPGRQKARVSRETLDHAVDQRDIFIITGIFASGLVPWPIGVLALTGVLMSSYLGTQAQAVGVGRYLRRGVGQGRPPRVDNAGRDRNYPRPANNIHPELARLAPSPLRCFRPYHRVPAVRLCLEKDGVIFPLLKILRNVMFHVSFFSRSLIYFNAATASSRF